MFTPSERNFSIIVEFVVSIIFSFILTEIFHSSSFFLWTFIRFFIRCSPFFKSFFLFLSSFTIDYDSQTDQQQEKRLHCFSYSQTLQTDEASMIFTQFIAKNLPWI